jgi:hypothetical protein
MLLVQGERIRGSILFGLCLGIWDGIRVVGAFACDLWLGLHIECIYVEMIDVGN